MVSVPAFYLVGYPSVMSLPLLTSPFPFFGFCAMKSPPSSCTRFLLLHKKQVYTWEQYQMLKKIQGVQDQQVASQS